MESMLLYLLVENMYPLTNHTLHQMFNDVKLQVDYECEMAFELLRLGRIVRIKSLLEVTAAKVCVTAAKQKIEDEDVNAHVYWLGFKKAWTKNRLEANLVKIVKVKVKSNLTHLRCLMFVGSREEGKAIGNDYDLEARDRSV
ncbi:hypothetical protein Tco_1047375 [Tanacetum coccineum]